MKPHILNITKKKVELGGLFGQKGFGSLSTYLEEYNYSRFLFYGKQHLKEHCLVLMMFPAAWEGKCGDITILSVTLKTNFETGVLSLSLKELKGVF